MKIATALAPLRSKGLEDKLGADGMRDLQRYLADFYNAIQAQVNGGLVPTENFGLWQDLTYNPAVAGNAQEFDHNLGRVPVIFIAHVNDVLIGDCTIWWTSGDEGLWTASKFRFRASQKPLVMRGLLV